MDDIETPVSVPDINFNRETAKKVTPEVRQIVHNSLRQVDHFVNEDDHIPSLHDLDYDESKEVLDLMFYQDEWLRKKVGVTMHSRIVGSKNIYMLEPDKFKEIYKRGKADETDDYIDGIRGAHSMGRQIIIRKSGDQERDALFLMHEFFHSYGEIMVRIKERPNGEQTHRELSVSRFGYQRETKDQKFGYFNEALIELMRVKMIHDYATEKDKQDVLPKLEVGYPQQVLLLDLLFENAAEILKEKGKVESRADLDRKVFQGYFTGSPEGLQLLHEVYGAKALKEIANYDDSDRTNIKKICEATGIDYSKFEARLNTLKSGGEVQVDGDSSFHFSKDQLAIYSE